MKSHQRTNFLKTLFFRKNKLGKYKKKCLDNNKVKVMLFKMSRNGENFLRAF